MAITEQIPLQQKIAELEERVTKLEKAHGVVFTKTTVQHVSSDSIFGDDWDRMWEHFHKVMHRAFKH